jgi:hypothetical protein
VQPCHSITPSPIPVNASRTRISKVLPAEHSGRLCRATLLLHSRSVYSYGASS